MSMTTEHASHAELIAKAQALDSAATSGPWHADIDGRDDGAHQVIYEAKPGRFFTMCFIATGRDNLDTVSDAEFIAESRTLLPQLAAALAQADAALAARWQPMDSCPQNGRIVLMFAVTHINDDGSVGNWKMATGCYTNNGQHLEWDGHRVDKPYQHRPTHWMPLPQPPRTDRET